MTFSLPSLKRLVAFVVALTWVPVLLAGAEMNPLTAGENRTFELVDELKDLIQRADSEQRSEVWWIRQLRDLVRRYDWPWRVALLHDDFHDGDYISNPSWVVDRGNFEIATGSLTTAFRAAKQGRYLADARGDVQTVSPSAAEIYTEVRISNAFVVKLQLKLTEFAAGSSRLEFGPYVTDERNQGYRLAYESGRRPSLSLLRIAPSRSAGIEVYDQGMDLEDGNLHTIEWRRRSDGEMMVLLDNKEILRAIDRAHLDSFDGFSIVNKGGVYEFKQISILGTDW